MTPHLPILACIAATAATAGAQNLPGNSNPNGFASQLVGTYTLFAANDQSLGMELWRLDHGTQAVTLVSDIRVGALGSDPRDLTPFLGGYVFSAYERSTGVELWRTDGTTSGTQLLKNIHATDSSLPRQLTVVGNRLFFIANDGTNGVELWSSDGTTAGTVLVKDINPTGDSEPRDLVACAGMLLFTANDGTNGRELWRSDGTAIGTVLVKDINTTGGSGARGLVVLGGIALFTANDGTAGSELWRTDGTLGGTSLVLDIEPGAGSSAPGEFHSQFRVFFAASTTALGRELWMSDGTALGTTLVSDRNPGTASSDPRDLVTVNFWDFWFVADDGLTGRELWRCQINGTGLVRKTDLVAGIGSVGPRDLVYTGVPDRLVFTDASGDPRLWGTDGSAAGASALASFRLGPIALTANRSVLAPTNVLFVADDGVTGLEPWRTDGTSAGTALVADIAPLPAPGVQPLLDGHVDSSGTLVTTCIENGHANGLGVIAFGPSPGPPLFIPGLINGPLLLSAILSTNLLLLDPTGTACLSFTVPLTVASGDLIAQGFSAGVSLPFESTDVVAIAKASEDTVILFGGVTTTTGTFCDEDHRYEVSVTLPPLPTTGAHPSGVFVFRHRFGYGPNVWLMDLEKHQYTYDGKAIELFFSGATPLVKNQGLELWFVDDETGEATFLWRSYC
ncbi:MAG: ELWxxDGT repeat protein [Planctomycetota bacterium]